MDNKNEKEVKNSKDLDASLKKVLDGTIKKKQGSLIWVQGKKDKTAKKFLIDKDTEITEMILSSAMKLISEKKIKLNNIIIGNSISLVFSVDNKAENKKAVTIKRILVKTE